MFTFLFGPCMRPCKQLFFIHKCSRHLLFCLFSICFLLLLAKEPLFPVGNPFHGVWVGWLCFNTGLESSWCLANQRTPAPMWLAGTWPSPLWGFSAGVLEKPSGLLSQKKVIWGAWCHIVPPTPWWESLLQMERMNRSLNATLQSVDPDRPEALALMNFPIILTNIV